MKINGYYHSGASELAAAITDMMALFKIPAAGTLATGKIGDTLPADSLFVDSAVKTGETSAVLTTVYYWQGTGGLGCSIKRTPLTPGGEPFAVVAPRQARLQLFGLLKKLLGIDPGPWGILRGVRPTKIVHRLFDEGGGPEQTVRALSEQYAVTPDRARLLTDIAFRQRPFLPAKGLLGRQAGVYVGIPYCPTRCLYCSFPANVLPPDRGQLDDFLAALTTDIEAAAAALAEFGLTAQSVYIGGGTPTSLGAEDFTNVLALVRDRLVGPATREFTVEAGRPDSITAAHIAAMQQYGVTRVSVNPQTMQEKTLKVIGRRHTVQDIIDVFGKIRQTGLPVINMDIIVGLPGEGEAEITQTLEQIAILAPENLTVHTLAIKRGSRLKDDYQDFSLPDEQTTARMLAITGRFASRMGLVPYYLYRQKYMTGNLENIGYARPGAECLYNIQTIEERQTLIGIGPAAGTKAVRPDFRLTKCYNPKDVTTYIRNLKIYVERRRLLLAGLFGNKEENI